MKVKGSLLLEAIYSLLICGVVFVLFFSFITNHIANNSPIKIYSEIQTTKLQSLDINNYKEIETIENYPSLRIVKGYESPTTYPIYLLIHEK